MSFTHIVAFQFKNGSSPEVVRELVSRMSDLKSRGLHPQTGQPYILSAQGGRDNSVQGLQNGLTHVFVVEFSSKEHRDYYALNDPVHLEFVQWSDEVVDKVWAIDFVNGVW